MIFKQPFLRNKQLTFIIYAPGTYRTANVCLLFHFLCEVWSYIFSTVHYGTVLYGTVLQNPGYSKDNDRKPD